jgi:hypothetical protein
LAFFARESYEILLVCPCLAEVAVIWFTYWAVKVWSGASDF